MRFTYQLTPNAGFHLVRLRRRPYPNNPRFTQSGSTTSTPVDYTRALWIARRTHFSFATGSALFYANQGVTNGPTGGSIGAPGMPT